MTGDAGKAKLLEGIPVVWPLIFDRKGENRVKTYIPVRPGVVYRGAFFQRHL